MDWGLKLEIETEMVSVLKHTFKNENVVRDDLK